MKRNEIERVFSEKTRELLNQGWEVNPSTMRGSQGEIAHIDLTDGKEIRRVLLEGGRAWSGDGKGFFGDTLIVRVGRNTEEIRPGRYDTIWNDKLDNLFQIEFAEIERPDRYNPDGWYVDLEEAKRISEIRRARRQAREDAEPADLGEAYKAVALGWLRKQPRMKSAKLADITRMARLTTSDGKVGFWLEAKGKRFILRA